MQLYSVIICQAEYKVYPARKSVFTNFLTKKDAVAFADSRIGIDRYFINVPIEYFWVEIVEQKGLKKYFYKPYKTGEY